MDAEFWHLSDQRVLNTHTFLPNGNLVSSFQGQGPLAASRRPLQLGLALVLSQSGWHSYPGHTLAAIGLKTSGSVLMCFLVFRLIMDVPGGRETGPQGSPVSRKRLV